MHAFCKTLQWRFFPAFRSASLHPPHLPRCPYYAVAEEPIKGTLTGVDRAWSVNYYAQLSSTTAACSDDILGDIPSGLHDEFQLTDPSALGSRKCGVYYQAQSQLPGRGPCYPVFTESAEFMNRCGRGEGPGAEGACALQHVRALLPIPGMASGSLNNTA